LDEPIAAWRQMAPLRAHTGLVRLCLAAEHAMTSRPVRLSKKGRHLERVMASRFSEALCVLAFPASYGAMRRWHELRAPRAIDELKEAKARLEAALSERLPAGSYRIEARVKTARSLFEKTVLRGKRVHDLCGLRVIVDTGVEAERRASWVASSQVASSPSGRCAEVALRVGEVVLDGLPLPQPPAQGLRPAAQAQRLPEPPPAPDAAQRRAARGASAHAVHARGGRPWQRLPRPVQGQRGGTRSMASRPVRTPPPPPRLPVGRDDGRMDSWLRRCSVDRG